MEDDPLASIACLLEEDPLSSLMIDFCDKEDRKGNVSTKRDDTEKNVVVDVTEKEDPLSGLMIDVCDEEDREGNMSTKRNDTEHNVVVDVKENETKLLRTPVRIDGSSTSVITKREETQVLIVGSINDSNATMSDTTKTKRCGKSACTKMAMKERFDNLKKQALDDSDAMSLAWRDSNKRWGTKSFGGRGAHSSEGCADIVVQNVTLAYNGRTLLKPTTLKIVGQRRYALVGHNGVGKSSLLHRVASGSLPGFPEHASVYLVEQEMLGHDDRDAIETLVDYSPHVSFLQEQGDDYELESFLSDSNRQLARDILTGLGFTKSLLCCKTSELSGGWRMRLSLGSALLLAETNGIDVLLLDEPTNHLDLEGLLFLEHLLSRDSKESGISSVIVVSHDEDFLRSFCTDVIVFENQALNYFAGDYEMYLQDLAEKRSRHSRLLDARVRQEQHVKASISKAEKQMSQKKKKKKKGKKGNEKKQKQISQRKKKMERIGLYRDDGKRYKLNSLKKLDSSLVRLPERVEMERSRKALSFNFPSARGVSRGGADHEELLLMLKDVNVGYEENDPVLRNVNLSIRSRDRTAIVGMNGSGKSTLLNAILGDDKEDSLCYVDEGHEGRIWRHGSLRVAHVSQHHLDELIQYFEMTPVEYMIEIRFPSEDISKLDARSHLAKFGVSGSLATRAIGFLSGGERTRLVLALAVYARPSLLVLDEPTNHLDSDSLDALGVALDEWDGAIVLVSHVRSFCRAFCRDLWVIEDGKLTVHEGSEEETPFHELLEAYCDGVKRNCVAGSMCDEKDAMHRRAKKVLDSKKRNKKKRKGGRTRGGVERSALI